MVFWDSMRFENLDGFLGMMVDVFRGLNHIDRFWTTPEMVPKQLGYN